MSSAGRMNLRVGVRDLAPSRAKGQSLRSLKEAVRMASARALDRENERAERVTITRIRRAAP